MVQLFSGYFAGYLRGLKKWSRSIMAQGGKYLGPVL